MTYYGYDVSDDTEGSTDLAVEIDTSSTATGVKTRPEYDYGKTWGDMVFS